ncbi:MAG: tetratricopeptide repeat protein, partial [Bacteroidetes bacterium]
MKIQHIRFISLGIAFATMAALFGCSTYQNMTSYFNTYYNAQKLFDDAVVELNKTPRTDRDTNYFVAPTTKSGGQSKFDKVIEKCSKLIQYYPESNLVDDAILLIGKSGVYLGESELAIRKFKELFQNFPESELRFEAKLWNAKALYFTNKQEEALALIEELYPQAVEAGENDVAIEAEMLAAQMYFKRGEYPLVVQHLEKAVQLPGSDALVSVAQYQLAICADRIGDYEKAALAYQRVLEFTPDLALEFRCRLRLGVMQYLSDKTDDALETFQELNDEALKPEEQALVDHEVANVYAYLGDSAKAFDLYEYVDTTYKRTDAAARSLYRQGELMEEEYGDFKTAKKYYDKAKNEFQSSEVAPKAQKRIDYLTKYFKIRDDIKKYDSLYFYLVHEDSIKEFQKKKQAQLAKNDSTRKDSLGVATDSLSSKSDSSLAEFVPKDSVSESIALNENESEAKDSLLAKSNVEVVEPEGKESENVTNPDEGKEVNREEEEKGEQGGEQEQQAKEEEVPTEEPQVTEEPVVPQEEETRQEQFVEESGFIARNVAEERSMHRDEDVMDAEYLSDEQLSGTQTTGTTRKQGSNEKRGDGKTNVSPTGGQTPATITSVGMTFEILDTLRSKSYYELGTLFWLDMNRPDSAEAMFFKVANEFPASPYVPRGLYTLAEIYRTHDDSCGADSLYRIIHAEHRATEYGKHLNKYFGEVEDTVRAVDSAEVKYARINLFPDSSSAGVSIQELET